MSVGFGLSTDLGLPKTLHSILQSHCITALQKYSRVNNPNNTRRETCVSPLTDRACVGVTTLAGRDRYPDTRMGIILSTTRYAPFSLVTGIIGLISFVFTLTTWLRVLWGNFTTAGMIFFSLSFFDRIAYMFLFLIDFEKRKKNYLYT